MKLNDEALNMLKDVFSYYSTFDEFYNDRPFGLNFDSEEDAKELFDAAKDDDFWYLTMYYISTDSLVINGQNKTVKEIKDDLDKEDLSKYKRIVLELDNKNYSGIEELNDININIYVKYSGTPGFCSIDEFNNMRAFFNTFMETYPTENLSPLEKVALAYDHVKFFEYQDVDDPKHSLDSRNIAKIFKTGNIVCAGYTYLFCQLLKEMGIESAVMSVIDTKEDDEFAHARPIVNVLDTKYNINGLYIFDPTWDSSVQMYLIETSDGKRYYDNKIYDDVKVIKELPRTISYDYFLIPAYEFKKYFPDEIIDTFEMYPSNQEVGITSDLNVDLLSSEGAKFSEIINILPDVLRVVKRVEGMPEDKIDEYIEDAMNLIIKNRFNIINAAHKF